MTAHVSVVRTGTANLASVLAGLRRTQVKAELTHDPEVVRTAHHLVLPGVGAFGAAMAQLSQAGLVDALRERIVEGRPTLAICLGLQMFAQESEESPGVTGLSVFDSPVVHLPDTVRVPQLGWNQVEPGPGCRLLEPGYAYFANSYAFASVPEGWNAATFDHGGRFIAAVERDAVLACQFHPELSGTWGHALLSRWVQT